MSFGKPAASFSNIYLAPPTFAFFLILSLFIFLPSASFSEKTSDNIELQRHLVLITKKTIVFEKEVDTLRKKPKTKENLKKIIGLQAQIDRLNLNFDSLATNLTLQDTSVKKKEKSLWTKQLEDITSPVLQAIRDLTEKQRKVDSLKKRIAELENSLAFHKEASLNLKKLATVQSKIANSSKPEETRYLSRLALLQNKYDPELPELNMKESSICEEIPTLIESGLKNLLSKYFEGISPDFNFLEVRFDNPGASSLNLMVVIHANGKCANRHEENRKEIQKALVQICNTNNLTIPFKQLTINMADGAQGSNPPLG